MFKFKEIGIDLGSNSIKIALVDKVGRSSGSIAPELRELKAYDVYNVDCPPYTKEYYQLLKRSLISFSKTHRVKRMSLNIALPIDNIHTHINFINMPMIGKRELIGGVNFEAQQKMAEEDIIDSHYTWRIIDELQDLNEYNILLANVKKDIIQSLSQFKTIKWKVNRVMVQPVLLERVASKNDVVVDFGHQSTRVYMYKEGKIAQAEILSVGGKDILKNIDDVLESRHEESSTADEMIQSVSVYSKILDDEDKFKNDDWYEVEEEKENIEEEEDQDILSELTLAIDGTVNTISDGIKRAIRMFELQNGFSIDNVYYMGQLSNLNYFKETIESELDVGLMPVDILDISNDNINDLTLYSMASLVSIDTHLKDETNFNRFIKANIDYTSLIIVLATITLSSGLALKSTNDSLDNAIWRLESTVSTQNQSLSTLDTEINYIEEVIDENEQVVGMFDELKGQKKWLSDILYLIPEKTPLTVSVTDIDIRDGNVAIKGYSGNYSSIGFFAKELEEFGEVEITSIDAHEDGDAEIYSVTMDNPELISDIYKIEQEFRITLTYDGTLMQH